MYVRNVLASIKNLLTRKILTMVMSNVRLFPGPFFLCVFALFANFYSWFSSVLWPPLQVFTTADMTVQDPGYAAGRGRGNWVEAWSIRGKIDCRMKSYADKLFIVLYFPVRSSRSTLMVDILQLVPNTPWGRELGFFSGGWGRREKWRIAGDTAL